MGPLLDAEKPRLLTFERALLIFPAAALVLVFLVSPLILLFRFSLNEHDPVSMMREALTLENYAVLVSDPFFRVLLLSTLGMAGLTMLLCLVGGLPLGYFIARLTSRRLKTFMILITLLPLLMGSAARTAGWMILLGDRGVFNSVLMRLGITAEPISIMYTYSAVLIGLVSVLLPFMVVALQSVIESIEISVEEASLSLGAPPLRTFWRVTFPLAAPGVAVGCLICFVLAMNAYATPRLLGGPEFRTMSTEMYLQITQAANWPLGASLAFALMLSTATFAAILTSLVLLRARRT